MSVKVFRLQGTYRREKQTNRFSKEVRALTEDHAREQLYSLLGSCHKIRRTDITIDQIDTIPPEEAEKLIIRKLAGIE